MDRRWCIHHSGVRSIKICYCAVLCTLGSSTLWQNGYLCFRCASGHNYRRSFNNPFGFGASLFRNSYNDIAVGNNDVDFRCKGTLVCYRCRCGSCGLLYNAGNRYAKVRYGAFGWLGYGTGGESVLRNADNRLANNELSVRYRLRRTYRTGTVKRKVSVSS